MHYLFSISLFLSALLLFIIQPMVAKAMLPAYGGTPMVWTVCMLFFQALLLVAYAYAWLLSKFQRHWHWRILHALLAVASLLMLPLVFSPDTSIHAPEQSILYGLLTQLGLPLLIIGASAPLLQYAYSQTSAKRAADPYFLYVASNIGSLLALLGYPWLVERYIKLSTQFKIWSIGYEAYLLLLFWILFAIPHQALTKTTGEGIYNNYRNTLWWVFLSFTACSLMLGVTFYISTDVGSTPFFWLMPLSLYLLSFIITFARRPLIPHTWVVKNTVFVLIFPVLGFILGTGRIVAWQIILFNLIAFFMLALLCHGELIRRRPSVQGLTSFYFAMAFGGVLAGLFNGILAPRLFSQAYEYPLAIILAVCALPLKRQKSEWRVPLVVLSLLLFDVYLVPAVWNNWVQHWHIFEILALMVLAIWQLSARSLALALGILFIFLFNPWFRTVPTLVQLRNFYGIKEVISTDNSHVLMSQTTVHGFQPMNIVSPQGTYAYYGAVAPVIEHIKAQKASLNVSLIGLGAGIMVCQFRPEDYLSLIEIDKQVVEIAGNPEYFTYLQSCPAQRSYIVNDGRMALTKKPDASEDIIVIDAFSSDAIPVHLLTEEAIGLYKRKLKPDGILLFNISNRHLRLLPVLTATGRAHEMIVLHLLHPGNRQQGQFASEWVLLTMNQPLAHRLINQRSWRFIAFGDSYLWTDDYSNLIPLLKW